MYGFEGDSQFYVGKQLYEDVDVDCGPIEVYELSAELFFNQQKEAADYLERLAEGWRELGSFVDSNSLLEVFKWDESPQGYSFWKDIYDELIELAYESVPPEYEADWYASTAM